MEPARGNTSGLEGFTLIELSIALVVIGLVVGGVLVGQDLIRSGQVRATITQIEKFQTAARTFYGKFGYYPGDINATAAATFGFASRGIYAGEGDGNGIIEGIYSNSPGHNNGTIIASGETGMFWVDLSSAAAGGLIDGAFNTAGISTYSPVTVTGLGQYLPEAKLGGGNYVYVWSGGWAGGDGTNYFGISGITAIDDGWPADGLPTIPVRQAYAIDNKIDDGLPQTGNVLALTDGWGGIRWARGDGNSGALPGAQGNPGILSCYDNNSTAGATMQYSMDYKNGAYTNCALSFRFQ